MVANNSDEQNGVIYKCCDEIDLKEMSLLNTQYNSKKPIPSMIAEKSLLASFGHYTFLSIFYHCEQIYIEFWRHLEEKFESENQGVESIAI